MLVFVICIYVGIFVIYDFYVDCFLDENYIIIWLYVYWIVCMSIICGRLIENYMNI